MIRAIVALFLTFILLETATANEVNSQKTAFLPKDFKAQFKEIAKIRKRKIEKNLVVSYKYPKNARLNYDNNSKIIVCNKEKMWVYTAPFIEGEKGQVDIGTSNKYCYSAIFDLLGHGLNSNKFYSVKKLNETKYELSFSQDQARRLNFAKMVLEFGNDKQLQFRNLVSLSLFEKKDSQPTRLVVDKLEVNTKLTDNDFVFDVPKNTKKVFLK